MTTWSRSPGCEANGCPEVAVLGSLLGIRDSDRPGGQAYFTVAAFVALLGGDWSAEIAKAQAAAKAREVSDGDAA